MATPTPRTEFINNPFMIAVQGINLLFLNAQGVAILLVVLSLVGHAPNLNNSSSPVPQNIPHIAPIHDIVPYIPVIIGTGVVALLVWLAIAAFLSGISGYSTAQVARGKTVTLSEAAKVSLRELPGLAWLQFLMAIKLLGWTLLFIVPGVIMSVRYSLAATAYFDQKLKGDAAIQYSIDLTRGSWITTFASMVLFNAITFNVIAPLINTAVAAVLYRQYSDTPNDQRPKPHGLSVATFVVVIAGSVMTIVLIALLWRAVANYVISGQTV